MLCCRYSTQLKGVVLSYSDIKLSDKNARIMYDCPFTHLDISAKMLAFAPVVGARIRTSLFRVLLLFIYLLVGTVKKQNRDYIGLLVYGVFNASIPSSQIRKEFSWHEGEEAWVHDATGEIAEVDTELVFTISALRMENEMLTLSGAMITSDTGFAVHCADVELEAPVSVQSIPQTPSSSEANASNELKKSSKKRKSEESSKKKKKMYLYIPHFELNSPRVENTVTNRVLHAT